MPIYAAKLTQSAVECFVHAMEHHVRADAWALARQTILVPNFSMAWEIGHLLRDKYQGRVLMPQIMCLGQLYQGPCADDWSEKILLRAYLRNITSAVKTDQLRVYTRLLQPLLNELMWQGVSASELTQAMSETTSPYEKSTLHIIEALIESWPLYMRAKGLAWRAQAETQALAQFKERVRHDKELSCWLVGSTGSVAPVRQLMCDLLKNGHHVVLPSCAGLGDLPSGLFASVHRVYSKLEADLKKNNLPFDGFSDPSSLVRRDILRTTFYHSHQEAHTTAVLASWYAQQGRKVTIVCADAKFAARITQILDGLRGTDADQHLDRHLYVNHLGYRLVERESIIHFAALLVAAASKSSSAVDWLSLLKHKLFCPDGDASNSLTFSHQLENILRGPRLKRGYEAIHAKLLLCDDTTARIAQIIYPCITQLEAILLADSVPTERALDVFCSAILQLTGQSLREFASYQSFEHGLQHIEMISGSDFAELWDDWLAAQRDTRVASDQPEAQALIHISDFFSARGLPHDVVIIPRLDQSADSVQPSPLLTEVTRQKIGLHANEYLRAQKNHDVVQLCCTARVVHISYAQMKDGKAVSPSCLWPLLEPLCQDVDPQRLHHLAGGHSAAMVLAPSRQLSAKACPPLHARPKKMSVSDFSLLVKDPYAYYLKAILKLEKIKGVSEVLDNRDYGIWLHKVVAEWARRVRRSSVAAGDNLQTIARQLIDLQVDDPAPFVLWLPRWERQAEVFFVHWKNRIDAGVGGRIEVEDKITQHISVDGESFTLTGQPDLVWHDHKNIVIVDYKSGSAPSKKSVRSFRNPQLPMLAWMYELAHTAKVSELAYWKLGPAGYFDDPYASCSGKDMDAIVPDFDHFIRNVLFRYNLSGEAYVCSTEGNGFIHHRLMSDDTAEGDGENSEGHDSE